MENCKICGSDNCKVGECYYPYGKLTMNPGVIVPYAYSQRPTYSFQLDFVGLKDLFVLDPVKGIITDALGHSPRFSAAIGGIFDISADESGYKVIFEGIEMKYFNVMVAVLMDGHWRLRFRFFTGANKIFCTEFTEIHTLDTCLLPEKFKMNTALVICSKSYTLNVNVNMFGGFYGKVQWTPTSFDTTLQIDELNRIDPNYLLRCPDCLVVSTSGHGHLNPCPPINTISCFRSTIYANTMTRVFQLLFDNPDYSIQLLDKASFVEVTQGKQFVGGFLCIQIVVIVLSNNNVQITDTKMISDVIEGMFSFKKTKNGKKIMTFSATSIKRFSIIIAFWHKNSWRMRTRLVASLTNGLIAFPLTKKIFMENGRISLPSEYVNNTALFIGIHAPTDVINLCLRIYANANGKNIYEFEKFNGYSAKIEWSRLRDEIWLSENLHSRSAKKLRFQNSLYVENGKLQKIGSFREQCFIPEPIIVQHEAPTQNVEIDESDRHEEPPQNVEITESDRHEIEMIEKEDNTDYNDFHFWRLQV